MIIAGLAVFLYICTTIFGVFINAFFSYKVFKSKLPRNPLLIFSMIADFSVCGLSCSLKTVRKFYPLDVNPLLRVVVFDLVEVCIPVIISL